MSRLTAELVLAMLLVGEPAEAQSTINVASSILFFPKVIVDGTHDTVIQIANGTNSLTRVDCFYLDNHLRDARSGQPCPTPSATCVPLFQETSFSVVLRAQQPTHWVASRGRTIDATDPPCSPSNTDCDAAGFDPGLIPSLVQGFQGDLVCVQTTDAGEASIGNSLTGAATLEGLTTNDVAQYAAIGIQGDPEAQPTGPDLELGGDLYEGCSRKWMVNQLADGAHDQQVGDASSVHTELTIIPCSHNFESPSPAAVMVQLLVTNELGNRFSTSTLVTGWANATLSELNLDGTTLATDYVQTRLQSLDAGGMVVVAQEIHDSGGANSLTRSAFANASHDTLGGVDHVVLPQP